MSRAGPSGARAWPARLRHEMRCAPPLGLSGGVDSALVAVAVDALGADAVLGIAAGRYSSSAVCATRLLVNQLGIELRVIPIEAAPISPPFWWSDDVSGLTDENLQLACAA